MLGRDPGYERNRATTRRVPHQSAHRVGISEHGFAGTTVRILMRTLLRYRNKVIPARFAAPVFNVTVLVQPAASPKIATRQS